jgi:hypothetical protein
LPRCRSRYGIRWQANSRKPWSNGFVVKDGINVSDEFDILPVQKWKNSGLTRQGYNAKVLARTAVSTLANPAVVRAACRDRRNGRRTPCETLCNQTSSIMVPLLPNTLLPLRTNPAARQRNGSYPVRQIRGAPATFLASSSGYRVPLANTGEQLPKPIKNAPDVCSDCVVVLGV